MRGGAFSLTQNPVHHSPDVAQPIELDALELSGKFVSDYLWGLMNTEW